MTVTLFFLSGDNNEFVNCVFEQSGHVGVLVYTLVLCLRECIRPCHLLSHLFSRNPANTQIGLIIGDIESNL